MSLTDDALALLREDADYLQDAKAGAAVGNTIIGSLMSITTGSPRWATEHAVRCALAILADESS